MSYIVVYLRADGSSGVEECADLDLAVVAAERLRNVDSVERPRIFKTEEVTYDFKPYYRVEVTTAADQGGEDDWVGHQAASPVAGTAAVMSSDPLPETVVEPQHVPEDVAPVEADVVEAATETAPPPPVMPAAEETEEVAAVEADDEVPAKKGLFGDPVPEPSADFPAVTQLADDVKDSVPPRRGLFGR